MHIHHAYMGLALMALSALSVACGFRPLGDQGTWVAWGVFMIGLLVFMHDVIWHITHRER
ncbi:MAG: hypothetical protein QW567_02945 [Candidatus Hadarchaeales archaeon]